MRHLLWASLAGVSLIWLVSCSDGSEQTINPLGTASPLGYFTDDEEFLYVTEIVSGVAGLEAGAKLYSRLGLSDLTMSGVVIEVEMGMVDVDANGREQFVPPNEDGVPTVRVLADNRFFPMRMADAAAVRERVIRRGRNPREGETEFQRGIREGIEDGLYARMFPDERSLINLLANDLVTLSEIYAIEAALERGDEVLTIDSPLPNPPYRLASFEVKAVRQKGGRVLAEYSLAPGQDGIAGPGPGLADRMLGGSGGFEPITRSLNYRFDRRTGKVMEWNDNLVLKYPAEVVPPGEQTELRIIKLTTLRPETP